MHDSRRSAGAFSAARSAATGGGRQVATPATAVLPFCMRLLAPVLALLSAAAPVEAAPSERYVSHEAAFVAAAPSLESLVKEATRASRPTAPPMGALGPGLAATLFLSPVSSLARRLKKAPAASCGRRPQGSSRTAKRAQWVLTEGEMELGLAVDGRRLLVTFGPRGALREDSTGALASSVRRQLATHRPQTEGQPAPCGRGAPRRRELQAQLWVRPGSFDGTRG